MFRYPFSDTNDGHHEDQLDSSQTFLTRTRRLLFLRGIISSSRMDMFCNNLVGDDILALNQISSEPITLLIDSPGGDVQAGLVLYDIIRLSPAPIITIGMNCVSMASLILAAGHRRLTFPHSKHMLHTPSGTLTGTVEQIETRQTVLKQIEEELLTGYLECGVTAGLDPKAGEAAIRTRLIEQIKKEHWLDAQESVAYGLVDTTINAEELFGQRLDCV